MLNSQLKSITALDPVSGFRIDLTSQFSKHLQLGGMWEYKKTGSGFTLNTALATDPMSQEATFVAGTYHDNGKLESKGLFNIGHGFVVNGEVMFQSADTRNAYYAVELAKNFSNCTAGIKYGTGMMSFSFMQTVFKNCFAGFECTYIVYCYVLTHSQI